MTGRLLEYDALRVVAAGSARPLIHGISLDLAEGEVLGLIGESGAGKSTLGLAALGHFRAGCRPAAGRVLFRGEDLLTLPPSRLRDLRGGRIAYIAQSAASAFNPAWRLGAQVAEAARQHLGLSRAAALEQAIALFAELDLPEPRRFARRYPHQVSGGQLQRAMIAMALAGQPELLVLDEPTSALDVTTQVEVLAAIRATLRRHGTAALYISHDLAVVAQFADRLAVLRHGHLVEQGPVGRLLATPAEAYTRRLLAVRETTTPPSIPSATAPLLSLHGLSASYRDRPGVLRDVTLQIAAGESVALVGTSGSGKSTLARSLCGLLPPTAGTMTFAGADLPPTLRQRTHDQLRRIQLVHQQPDTALNPRQRIGRILGRAVRFHTGLSRAATAARVAELLARVGLAPELAERRPPHLSGGQKQRVAIARALAARPDLIICDEVTSALDPLVADEILALLQRLQVTESIAYLFITHDIALVRRMAGRVAVMKDGAIAEAGAVAEVFAPPLHPHVALLLAAEPQLHPGWLEEVLARRPLQPGRPLALAD